MSRASALAKIQAKIVGNQLEDCYPNLKVEYYTATTSADKNMEINIANSGSVGLFTKDISDKIINEEFSAIPEDLVKSKRILNDTIEKLVAIEKFTNLSSGLRCDEDMPF